MKTTLYPKFIELYESFRNSVDYADRKAQFAVVAINKEIIEETIKNTPLLNEHLTGLIQMFKYGCSNETFDKYLLQNITDITKRKELSDRAQEVNEWGYTGAGLNAIQNISDDHLQIIKVFLQNALITDNINEATFLCSDFDSKGVPFVKSGIYSLWLYYINPQLFPIINNSHNTFREWLEIPSDYPSCINDFNELKALVGENDLGLIDIFAYNFERYQKAQSNELEISLGGKKIYKVSHGIFKNATDYKSTGMVELLEKNKWACLHSETGKNQGREFEQIASIGDFVYICYGGDDLYCIGKIISDARRLDADVNELFKGDGKWVYRVIEPLYYPKTTSVRELKSDTRFFMPSGNSTFYEVPTNQLDTINEKIFIPKFGIKIINYTTTPLDIKQPSVSSFQKINFMKNQILYGPPGTGKTYNTINKAISIIDNIPEINLDENREDLKKRFDELLIDDWENPKGQIAFVTFHQSMSYEDFIEGIKPGINNEQRIIYDIEPGIFKQMASLAKDNWLDAIKGEVKQLSFEDAFNNFKEEWEDDIEMKFPMKRDGKEYTIVNFTKSSIRFKKASGSIGHTLSISTLRDYFYKKKDVRQTGVGIYYPAILEKLNQYQPTAEAKKEEKPFVLIIDEINRGNVSQIFGELITLIEEDKRLGKPEALEVTLPYSKEKFGVPPNLYIIGTMNTADRSVEALDAALRRRFSFEEMPAIHNLPQLDYEYAGIKINTLLETINKRIEKLLDKDHAIGHAYFMLKDNEQVEDKIPNAFYKNIIPLLQEYFFGDYGKIGMVLGEGFVQKKIWTTKGENAFAYFNTETSSDFDDRDVYEIIKYTKAETKTIIVKNKAVDFNFEKAIRLLMNQEVE
jgi:AAA domain (dynein-related subfamily)